MKCKILIRYLIVRGCYQIILSDKTVGLIHAGTRKRFITTDPEGLLMLIYKVLKEKTKHNLQLKLDQF